MPVSTHTPDEDHYVILYVLKTSNAMEQYHCNSVEAELILSEFSQLGSITLEDQSRKGKITHYPVGVSIAKIELSYSNSDNYSNPKPSEFVGDAPVDTYNEPVWVKTIDVHFNIAKVTDALATPYLPELEDYLIHPSFIMGTLDTSIHPTKALETLKKYITTSDDR